MNKPSRRHRRPAVSCALCRRRKLRCSRETPCANCVRARNAACVYENHASQAARLSEPSSAASADTAATAPRQPSSESAAAAGVRMSPTPLDRSYASEFEAMKARVRELEDRLSEAAPTPKTVRHPASIPDSGIDAASSSLGGTIYFHREGSMSSHPRAITRSVSHKTRLLGQSHWINGVSPLQDVVEVILSHLRDESSAVYPAMQRCKSLAKAIKSRRAPPWPSSPTKDLPGREVADELVDCYLRTVETVHRILHIPSFRRDYEALWTPASEPDMAFLVQLKLVFAIGATTYDEQFSLRTSAIRWVYEAQTWISEPEFKARLGIQFLQINVLLLLARELVGVGGDSVWVSAGALLRRAVSMGLHRDPAHLPKSTIFATEMRRRLWNTILEVVLQSSLTSGGPPLVSLDDFDAQPPRNLDDEQLVADNPVPKPASQFTQATVAIALRATFPLRLAVTKFLNDLSAHGTYEETLRLDAQLRAAYRALRRSLRGGHGSNTGLAPSAFALRAVDFLINRYLSALHVPFFALAALEPAYAFSRAVVLEASLKIWCAACPASTALPTQPRSNSESESASNSDITASLHDALPRLVACGSGYYRTAAMQAALLVAIELKTALEEEDEGLGPVRLRPDLLAVLADAEAWCLRCVEIGETNVKGYVLVCVVTALIRGLSARLGRNEIHALLVKAMRNAAAACVPLLEGMAARGWGEESVGEAQQMALGETSVLDDWDKLMADSLFEPEGLEPMNWIFGETPQGTAAW